MQRKNVVFWVVTGLFTAVYFMSGMMDVLHVSRVEQTLAHLGYPAYLGNILGPWKLAAVATLLAPGFPRVKEWAYAGAVFDLTGALVSHLSVGDTFPLVPPTVLLALLVSSWVLRPASRKLASPSELTIEERPTRVVARAA